MDYTVLGSVGRAAMMSVATPIIMDSHITVGINFHGWENFVTAKSTTKITKISTPRNYLPYGMQISLLYTCM